MNAKKYKIFLTLLLAFAFSQAAFADSAAKITSNANQLYKQGKFDKAMEQYDQAIIDSPQAPEPKFNKADSYYRLDDLQQAANLYSQVAAESKNMKLVAKSKYNLGNCSFQQGTKQRDSNPQKAIEDMQTAISNWRSVLDMDPQNQKAAKNIEVARLTIKDLIDQIKNQQDPNQPQDPNQSQQGQQQQQQGQQDPNKPQDPNQQQQQSAQQDPNQSPPQADKQDPNKPQEQEKQQQAEEKKEEQKSDAAAQEILDKEQRDKEQRQNLQKAGYRKVEKDW